MADEEEDKGWMHRPPAEDRPPRPQRYYPSRTSYQPYTQAFKTDAITAKHDELEREIEKYKQQYPVEAYATEFITTVDNYDGTSTARFRRYPTAE